jgi:hypothetical protein
MGLQAGIFRHFEGEDTIWVFVPAAPLPGLEVDEDGFVGSEHFESLAFSQDIPPITPKRAAGYLVHPFRLLDAAGRELGSGRASSNEPAPLQYGPLKNAGAVKVLYSPVEEG